MRRAGKIIILVTLPFLAGLLSGVYIAYEKGPAGLNDGQATPLTDREYFGSVKNFIGSANSSVRIIMFDIKYYPEYPESPSNLLIAFLSEAAAEGVDVRIITDEWLTEKPVLTMLEDAGVMIKYDSRDVTTHAKLIIIDSKIVIIGSTNWSYHSIDENHEANAVISSASLAAQFEDYFNSIWSES